MLQLPGQPFICSLALVSKNPGRVGALLSKYLGGVSAVILQLLIRLAAVLPRSNRVLTLWRILHG